MQHDNNFKRQPKCNIKTTRQAEQSDQKTSSREAVQFLITKEEKTAAKDSDKKAQQKQSSNGHTGKRGHAEFC